MACGWQSALRKRKEKEKKKKIDKKLKFVNKLKKNYINTNYTI